MEAQVKLNGFGNDTTQLIGVIEGYADLIFGEGILKVTDVTADDMRHTMQHSVEFRLPEGLDSAQVEEFQSAMSRSLGSRDCEVNFF